MASFIYLIILLLVIDLMISKEPVESKQENFDYLILVNKEYKIPDDYLSKVDLIVVHNFLREEKNHTIENMTYQHFCELKNNLQEEENITIELDSVYRTVQRQQEIWDKYVRDEGIDYARKYVAQPGYSEHHTGLAVDICLRINGTIVDNNTDMIAQKEIFSKIHAKLPDYGFILRFLKGKEDVTGYNYEPWHLRFVTKEYSKNITEKNITLEEFLGKLPKKKENRENYINYSYSLFFAFILFILI